jgi:hypothetical protein
VSFREIVAVDCGNYIKLPHAPWATCIGVTHFKDIVTEVYSGAVWSSLICDVRASVECATVCHKQLADVTNGCPCSIRDPQHCPVRWYAYASRRSQLVLAFLCTVFQTLPQTGSAVHPLPAMKSPRLLIFTALHYIYYPTDSGTLSRVPSLWWYSVVFLVAYSKITISGY